MVDFVKFKKSNESDDEIPKKRRSMFSFKRIALWFLVFFIISSVISSISMSIAPKIAVVPITGAIMTSNGGSSLLSFDGTNSRDISEKLYDIAADSSIKGVILDINSPGGSPVAAEEISAAIEYVKAQGIPVYSTFSDLGASGAFWIAMSADKVYSSGMSTIGSIGVTSAGLGFERLIENYNISYRRQTSGEFKDMGSPYRAPTETENEKVQIILDEIHSAFINHIANARNLSYLYVLEDATGEIFLGNYAKERGYVDVIGNYKDALNDMKELVGESSLVMDYGPQPKLFDGIGIETMMPSFDSKSQVLLR
jgi:protease-4